MTVTATIETCNTLGRSHHSFVRRCVRVLMIAASSLTMAGCYNVASDVQPIQAGEFPAAAQATPVEPGSANFDRLPYALTPGDEVAIDLLDDERLDRVIRVDFDGGFQFPYAGRVQAEGLTTLDLQRKLTSVLAEFYTEPNLTVNLVSDEQQYFTVLGEARSPGRYPIDSNMRLTDAIAAAGGLLRTADESRVVLIRRVAQEQIAAGFFDYRGAMLMNNPDAWASNIQVQRGDTLYFPRSDKAQWESAFQFISMMFSAVVDVERAIVLYPDVRDVIETGDLGGRNTIVVR